MRFIRTGDRVMNQVLNCPRKANVISVVSSHRVAHENESPEQQRANLRRALAAAEQSVQRFPRGISAHRKAKARVNALQRELRILNGQLGGRQKRDLGEVIISIIKERLSDVEWQGILSEARKRYQAKLPSESIASFAS
ncbi:hypothetical protein GCM10027093_19600 [Paraburkholderia jirisanensis]